MGAGRGGPDTCRPPQGSRSLVLSSLHSAHSSALFLLGWRSVLFQPRPVLSCSPTVALPAFFRPSSTRDRGPSCLVQSQSNTHSETGSVLTRSLPPRFKFVVTVQ